MDIGVIKGNIFGEGVFVKLVVIEGVVLLNFWCVNKFEVDNFNVFVLDLFEDFLGGFGYFFFLV